MEAYETSMRIRCFEEEEEEQPRYKKKRRRSGEEVQRVGWWGSSRKEWRRGSPGPGGGAGLRWSGLILGWRLRIRSRDWDWDFCGFVVGNGGYTLGRSKIRIGREGGSEKVSPRHPSPRDPSNRETNLTGSLKL